MSLLEERVRHALEALDWPFEREVEVHARHLTFWIDFVVSPPGRVKVALEVDGPDHDETERSKRDAYRDMTLGVMGWHTVRLSYREATSDEAIELWLRRNLAPRSKMNP